MTLPGTGGESVLKVQEVSSRRHTSRKSSGDRLPPPLSRVIAQRRDAFQRGILFWGSSHLRSYPWRLFRQNPYAVLVAELLLKRTTAAAAARVYDDFLRKFPTPAQLAAATEDELARDLAPVGLHLQRAKAIAELARYLIECESGSVPESLDRLLRVPGLGDYAARAVRSFGYGIPSAVVDANVARVICRVFGKEMPPRPSPPVLQAVADAVFPRRAHREFNFGMLDLGALVCRYVRPKCDECPLSVICDLYGSDCSTDREVFHSRLREIRLANKMSLAELAKKSGVSKLTIINIEAGRTTPRPETIQRLTVALGVSSREPMT